MEQALLDWLLPHVSTWGYPILFLFAYLESAAFFGMLVPGETAVVVAGALAAHGLLALDRVLLITIIGAVAGDSTGYYLGHRLRRPLFTRERGALLARRRLQTAERFFARYGGVTVLFGRFLSWLRPLVPFVAGATRMHYPSFLFFNVYGGVAWSFIFVLLGYLLGGHWQAVLRLVKQIGIVVLALIALAVVLVVWYRRRPEQWRTAARYVDARLSRTAAWRTFKHLLRAADGARTRSVSALVALFCGAALIAVEWDAVRGATLTAIGAALREGPWDAVASFATVSRAWTACLALALVTLWLRQGAWRRALLFGASALVGTAALIALARAPMPADAGACYGLLVGVWLLHWIAATAAGEVARTIGFTVGVGSVALAAIEPILQYDRGYARVLAGYALAGLVLAISFLARELWLQHVKSPAVPRA